MNSVFSMVVVRPLAVSRDGLLSGITFLTIRGFEVEHGMRIRSIIGIALLSANSMAFAQTYEGYFKGFMASANVLSVDFRGVAAVSVRAFKDLCIGEVAGIGNLLGRTITFEPFVKDEHSSACKVTLTYDAGWRTVTIQSTDACSGYHGGACGWEDQVLTRQEPTWSPAKAPEANPTLDTSTETHGHRARTRGAASVPETGRASEPAM